MLEGWGMKFDIGRRLSYQRPPRRRMNRCAIGKCDGVRQLALRRKICRNVFVERSETLKLKTGCLMRIENSYWLFKAIPDGLDWRCKVRVSGDERNGVGGAGHGIHQHFRRDVDIGALFFQLDNGCQMIRNFVATLAGFLVKGHQPLGFLVESFDELEVWKCRQGLPVVMLVQLGLWIRRIGFGFGCEIFDGNYVMLGANECLGEFDQVKPTIRFVLEEPVEEIESVDVNNGFNHNWPCKMLRPGLLPASRRIGSASAGGSNPSWGSSRIISFFAEEYYRANLGFLEGFLENEANGRTINDAA